MKKATGTRTATTHTLLLGFPHEDREGLTGTYVWPSEDKARETVRVMTDVNGFEHTVHFAPGLEVHAFYVNGELCTVIEFADGLAADLHTAVRKQQPVTVSYTKADGTDTVRTVEPTSVTETKAGDLLVRGTDRESEGTRSFRLDRISAYTVHRTRFTVRTPAPAPRSAEETCDGTGRRGSCNILEHWDYVDGSWVHETVQVITDIYSTEPGTAAALEAPWEGLTPSGTVRVRETGLIRL